MPGWNNVYDGFQTADTSVPNITETVALTISGINTPGPGARVKLHAELEMLTGTTTSAVTPRWRRGVDATGVLIGEGNPIGAGPTSVVNITHDVEDSPGELGNATYVLTVQQTGAGSAGTVQQVAGTATIGA